MAIRYVDRRAYLGRVAASLEDATGLIEGSHTPPPARAGVLAAQLAPAVLASQGGFTPSANRTGTLQSALSSAGALFTGTFLAAGGSAVVLTWEMPTLNEDGTPVNPAEIASLILQAGTYPGGVTLQKSIPAPATSHQWVDALFASGTWYFRVIAVHTSGAQSLPSAEIVKTLP